MTACPHTALIHSDSYPRGTRCSQCGQSVESLFANCRAQLTVALTSLDAARVRTKTLEESEAVATHLRNENIVLIQKIQELTENSARFAQAETHLRNEQHYHQQTKNELQEARELLLENSKECVHLAERVKELQTAKNDLQQRLEAAQIASQKPPVFITKK